MNRTLSFRWAISLIAVAGLLGGCSWFRHDNSYYVKAKQTAPLEVPPDLDTPVSSDAMAIPQSGSTGTATQASAGSAPPAGPISGGGSLRIADNVDHAWQRVGIALERAQEILYHLAEGIRDGRLPQTLPVFLDSPMAISATETFSR